MTTVRPADIEMIRRILSNHTGFWEDDTPLVAFNRLVAELYVARSRALPAVPRGWIISKLEDHGSYASCSLFELSDRARESQGDGETIFAAVEAAVAKIGLRARKPRPAKKSGGTRRKKPVMLDLTGEIEDALKPWTCPHCNVTYSPPGMMYISPIDGEIRCETCAAKHSGSA